MEKNMWIHVALLLFVFGGSSIRWFLECFTMHVHIVVGLCLGSVLEWNQKWLD